MKDRDVSFFRPLWRRTAVTAVCVVWAGLELFGRDPTWIVITLGLTAYAIWTFFISFPREAPPAATAAGAAPAADSTLSPPARDGETDVPPAA